MVCLKKEEILGQVRRDAAGSQRPLSFCLAQSVLTDSRIDVFQRQAAAFAALKRVIEGMGGTIGIKGGPCGLRVEGEVRVYGGKPVTQSMKRVGTDGKTDSMILERSGTIDEKIVAAVLGYGEGSLDVSYLVKGDSSFYVIRTNGSRMCLEERQVQVAIALAGAAEIARGMLDTGKNIESAEPVEPLRPMSKAA
jgi:hypothetical protein